MDYKTLSSNLKTGWNTWNTRSVLSHVYLPSGVSINLGVRNYQTSQTIYESLIGRLEETSEKVRPGIRSYDGSYTSLYWKQCDLELLIESAAVGKNQYLLVTPLSQQKKSPALFISGAILWNKEGYVKREGEKLVCVTPGETTEIFCDGEETQDFTIGCTNPYLCVELSRAAAVSTGKRQSVDEVRQILDRAKEKLMQERKAFGENEELRCAIMTCMAWDTIYEPENDTVCSPVSRLWNIGWGGYVLFCWDTYFASLLSAVDNKELAYANAIAITRQATEAGFVPNFGAANNNKSRDRSQPPAGSHAALELYRKFGEKWFLQEIYDALLTWNRWWTGSRFTDKNTLCWGSDPYEPFADAYFERTHVNDLQGAAWESGLDNSPMYDDVPYDGEKHMMCLEDVGLTALYIMDCEALAKIAEILEKPEDQKELSVRAEKVKQGLETLWDEETGIYQNRRTDTGEFYRRISATNFYSLFSDKVPAEHVRRMIDEHFYNENEFWGEYMIPTIARNDPAYPDQEYWRGRIWAPTNYLAYAAMKHAGLTKECRCLAEKSENLFLKEWRENGHVHENYNGTTGEGCDVSSSDRFYHWGALLALIGMDGRNSL